MYDVTKKELLTEQVVSLCVFAPRVAKKCQPGQFIILRVNKDGERIPLTIADFDREEGTITIIFQIVGKTTMLLSQLEVGDCLHDFVGPLGHPSDLEGKSKVAVIGGGLGCAIAYPSAKALFQKGVHVDIIAGFRSDDFVILEEEMKKTSNTLYIMTDDGSYGEKGLVTQKLKQLIEDGNEYDTVIAIGPLIMMKFVSLLTLEYGIKTIVSMNPIMIDGTGMCGCCRVNVDGETKFACVDGPEFEGHKIDFDETMRRASMYKEQERLKADQHKCKMEGMQNG